MSNRVVEIESVRCETVHIRYCGSPIRKLPTKTLSLYKARGCFWGIGVIKLRGKKKHTFDNSGYNVVSISEISSR